MTNDAGAFRHCPFELRPSFVLRSSFVLRPSFVIRHLCFVISPHVLRHPRPSGPSGVRRRSRRGDRAAREAGVTMILCPALSAESSRAVVRLAEQYDLLAAVGIHPNSTHEATAGHWEQIAAMIDHPRVAALGETGLDRYWDFAPLSLQQEYIDRHLRLSQACDLPVILHCRDAQADLLAALRRRRRTGRSTGSFTPSAATRLSPPNAWRWGYTSALPAT